MYPCLELAGFAAAQAVCCLFDRQPMLPLAFSRRGAGTPAVKILPATTPEAIAAEGRRWFAANVEEADEAVIVADAFVTIAAVKKDALLLDLRSYRNPAGQMRMAVPYRPHHHPDGFAVYRPKFIVAAIEGQDAASMTGAFFRGVSSHLPGWRVWNACADESW